MHKPNHIIEFSSYRIQYAGFVHRTLKQKFEHVHFYPIGVRCSIIMNIEANCESTHTVILIYVPILQYVSSLFEQFCQGCLFISPVITNRQIYAFAKVCSNVLSANFLPWRLAELIRVVLLIIIFRPLSGQSQYSYFSENFIHHNFLLIHNI